MIDVIKKKGFPIERMKDGPNETSKTYKVDGFMGSIGFITSMSDHFCSTCNRIRMMADGALKVCLFGPNEVSLRDMMRAGATDDEYVYFLQSVTYDRALDCGIGYLLR